MLIIYNLYNIINNIIQILQAGKIAGQQSCFVKCSIAFGLPAGMAG